MEGHINAGHSYNFSACSANDLRIDLRTGGRLLHPQLGQSSSKELMMVSSKGFIPLSPPVMVNTTKNH